VSSVRIGIATTNSPRDATATNNEELSSGDISGPAWWISSILWANAAKKRIKKQT